MARDRRGRRHAGGDLPGAPRLDQRATTPRGRAPRDVRGHGARNATRPGAARAHRTGVADVHARHPARLRDGRWPGLAAHAPAWSGRRDRCAHPLVRRPVPARHPLHLRPVPARRRPAARVRGRPVLPLGVAAAALAPGRPGRRNARRAVHGGARAERERAHGPRLALCARGRARRAFGPASGNWSA